MTTATSGAGRVRELVDRRLAELLAQETGRLDFLGPDGQEVLRRFLVDFVTGGGKRLRPSFVYWGHRAAGGSADEDAVLLAGCAVELLHSCALLLDDIMDEADTRRGRVTAHLALAEHHRRSRWRGDPRRFGESVAALLGMLAFTWADTAMLRAGDVPGEAWEVFTRLRVEIIGGQYLDLTAAARGRGDLDEAARISTYKSGKYTVERPLHLGHAIAGGDPDLRAVLSAYALPLGAAFQLRDDVLGVFGDPERTGKPAGADLLQGKQTYLTVETRRRAGERGTALLEDVRDGARLAAVRELIVATGALDATERRIRALVDEATGSLAGAGLPPDAGAALVELAGTATGGDA